MNPIWLLGIHRYDANLKVVEVEHDLAWLPYFFNRLDVTYIERPTQTPYRFKGVMRCNVFHSFQEDGLGIRDRDIIGVENLLWGSDYPHPDGVWPDSRKVIEGNLGHLDNEIVRKVVYENTAKLR